MKYINLGITLTDELGIKSVVIYANDTELESDSGLIKLLAYALLKSMVLNKDDLELQDLLSKYGISKSIE